MKKVKPLIKFIPILSIIVFVVFLYIETSKFTSQNQAAKDSKADVIITHNIGIRPGTNGSEFYEKNNGQKFIPRGMNYMRIDIPTQTASVMFNIGKYDHNRNNYDLKVMSNYGYNIIRIFIDPTSIGSTTGPGLSTQYMANLGDFLKIAQQNNIYI